MAEVVVLGAGLSGTIMAYELVPKLRQEDRLTVIGQGSRYHFVPSNPWWQSVGGIVPTSKSISMG
jgi:sulfide:quinone oxidoreductase